MTSELTSQLVATLGGAAPICLVLWHISRRYMTEADAARAERRQETHSRIAAIEDALKESQSEHKACEQDRIALLTKLEGTWRYIAQHGFKMPPPITAPPEGP